MTNSKIKKSLKRRIYTTCCVLVGLCLVASLIGWVGQSNLMLNFAVYEKSEVTLNQISDLDRDVQELKSRAERYLSSGAASHLARATELQERLVREIESVNSQAEVKDISETLSEMRNALDVFSDRLARAAEERDLRTQLIQRDLPKQDTKVRELIAEMRSLVFESGTSATQLSFTELVQSHGDSRQWLQRYFIDPDSGDYDRAVKSIENSRLLVKKIVESVSDDETGNVLKLADLSQQLDAELLEFKRQGSRAFQATRGYMFYSDVVMAGEISEFIYYSDQVKQYVENRRVRNREARQSSASRSQFLVVFASLLAVSLAVLMATRLSYLIVSPISQITETFRKLGQGETVSVIPALDRKDEIGRMARAAKIFNDKNEETRELLERSERLADELAHKALALEKSNGELDNFAYVASHDLKSPLRGINHLTTWISEDFGELLPDEGKEHLEKIRERVGKMEGLLNDLLEYSRVGRMNPQPEQIDIGELIASVVSMVDTPPGFRINFMNPTFKCETIRTPLTQVLLNLISNGVKYNDKGGQGYLEVYAEKRDGFMHFKVKDNGRGIPPECHERVFDMYQRIAIDVKEGTGMGLAIVKKQVLSFGGELSLESKEGEGAVFSFSWPCVVSARDHASIELVDPAANV